MRKLGRNDQCWCGSGKKYKLCHLDRESEKPANANEWIKKKTKRFSKKECMVPPGMRHQCSGQIIKAHSISKSANLKGLAVGGHVYGFSAELSELKRSNGRLRPKAIGIARASTFLGFCSHHDSAIFSCVENEEFAARSDQMLALSFRSVCREFYGKQAIEFVPDMISEMDRGKGILEQTFIQEVAGANRAGVDSSKNDFAEAHRVLGNALEVNATEEVECLIMEYDSDLPFAFSSTWTPLQDILGNWIQDGTNHTILLETVSAFSAKSASKTYLCLTWLSRNPSVGRQVADSICSLPIEKITSAFVQFIFLRSDNIFFRKDWHQALSTSARNKISELIHDGIDPFLAFPDSEVDPDIIIHNAAPSAIYVLSEAWQKPT